MWPAGQPIVRVHNSAYGATEPHPGPDRSPVHGLLWPTTRFAHFRSTPASTWVPSLYGGADDTTAIAETLLRDNRSPHRPHQVRLARWRAYLISTVAPNRPLVLLHLTEPDLTQTPRTTYPNTVTTAQDLHGAHPDIHGLRWPSRQHPFGLACVLWVGGTASTRRIARETLDVIETPIALTSTAGQERILAAAERLGVTVIATPST